VICLTTSERRRRCWRWLAKCGAAQTGPRAAPALTDPQWSCPQGRRSPGRPIAQLPQPGTRHLRRRWIHAWGRPRLAGLTRPRSLLLVCPSRGPGFRKSKFRVSFENRAGWVSEVMSLHAQAVPRHARQEAAGTLSQAPARPNASGAKIRQQAA
jgi:hypothetical protein